MENAITLIISLFAALFANVTKKYYSGKNSGLYGGFFFNAVGCVTAAAVLLLWGGFGGLSAFSLILGIAFGAVTALQGICNIAALRCGPMSYTTVIISFATVISAMTGVLFYNEQLHWAQIVGILFMLASFVFAADSNQNEKKANLKWLVLSVITFLATGAIGVMQKVHQSSHYRLELNGFLITAFISSAIFCAVFAVIIKSREVKKTKKPFALNKDAVTILAVMLIGGLCVAVNNKLNLYLSGVMESAVFFPIVNGGGLVLATVTAVIAFKERLTKKQWLGVVLGIISVVFLCNPFS
ncbi:MAG: EamA family transporter [Clostridia bacterium]|nr:EamA family transporter [Clostridia bacterium]